MIPEQETKPNLEQQLVEALRSGKYEQTRNTLRNADGFCCLGVACDISKLGEWVYDDGEGNEYDNPLYLHKDGFLPHTVRLALGWETDTAELVIRDKDNCTVTLASLNDEGFTFAQIADIIAAGLVKTNS